MRDRPHPCTARLLGLGRAHRERPFQSAFALTPEAVRGLGDNLESIDHARTHGGHAGYVVQAVAERVDRFLAAYLRVNEGVCAIRDSRLNHGIALQDP